MKKIPGLEYSITEFGDVWSHPKGRGGNRTCFKAYFISNKGYKRVNLYNNNTKKNYYIHRLVALTYIPNPENKPHINHIDGNQLNNHISNLEWCTHSENMLHKYRILGSKSGKPWLGKFGKNNPFSKPIIGYTESGTFYQEFDSLNDAVRDKNKYGFNTLHQASLSKCLKNDGRLKSCGKINYEPVKWKYKE